MSDNLDLKAIPTVELEAEAAKLHALLERIRAELETRYDTVPIPKSE